MSDEEAEADMNESQRLIIKTCMDRRESEWNTNSVRHPIKQQQWVIIRSSSDQISLPILELKLSRI